MKIKTHFAPPDLSSNETVLEQVKLIQDSPLVSGLLHTVCGLLAVLNQSRQIVALNYTFMKMLGIKDPMDALGLRPGKVLKCIHEDDGPAGCGTTKFCSTCGAAVAIVAALGEERPVERLCALTHDNGQTALHVTARPVHLDGSRFVLIFLQDITESQRRAALERTFFHDVSNQLNMLLQAGELLSLENPSQLVTTVRTVINRLVKEVEIQRIFAGSESSDFPVRKAEVELDDFLKELELFFRNHPSVSGKTLTFLPLSEPVTAVTDRSLLSRVLENMIINALEASQEGREVVVSAEKRPSSCAVSVHNDECIPDNEAMRIFQRNFSTKAGSGRGYGTYAMKLIGEELLQGKIGFTSSPEQGTVFTYSFLTTSD